MTAHVAQINIGTMIAPTDDPAVAELKLETGPRQVAASGLYQRAGYERCEAWGEYLLTPETSRCYAKRL